MANYISKFTGAEIDEAIEKALNSTVDETLSINGQPADAKATGDKIRKNEGKINTLYNILEYKKITQVAENVENNLPFSQTGYYFEECVGEGVLNIVDGSYTTIKKIKGKGTISGIKSVGRNTAKADNFIGRSLVKNNDGTYTITRGSGRFSGTADLNLLAGYRRSSAEIISIYDPRANDGNGGYVEEAEFSLGLIFYANGVNVSTGGIPAKVGVSIDSTKSQSVITEKCEIYFDSKSPVGYSITFKNLMISSGSEYIPYEPYTDSVMTLPTPLTLSEFEVWEDNKVKDYTKEYEFGTETTYHVFESIETNSFRTEFALPDYAGGTIFPVGEYAVSYGLSFEILGGYLIVHSNEDLDLEIFNSLMNDNNGVKMAYKSTTPQSERDFTIDNEYQVYNGGTTQVQGATEGVNATLTNDYLTYVGEDEEGDK